jgi:tetratricopeptide (TPR) repeat protein
MAKNESNISRLAKAIKKDPDDIFSKFALALELLKVDSVEKAQLLFEAVLKQDPDYLGVYYHLGKLYQSRGYYKQALQLFDNGIKLAERQKELRTKSELQEAIQQLRLEMDE